jgi:hypothetical protein
MVRINFNIGDDDIVSVLHSLGRTFCVWKRVRGGRFGICIFVRAVGSASVRVRPINSLIAVVSRSHTIRQSKPGAGELWSHSQPWSPSWRDRKGSNFILPMPMSLPMSIPLPLSLIIFVVLVVIDNGHLNHTPTPFTLQPLLPLNHRRRKRRRSARGTLQILCVCLRISSRFTYTPRTNAGDGVNG